MDRNVIYYSGYTKKPVALRKESVDRNLTICNTTNNLGLSLSARRAWIEINAVYKVVAYDTSRSPQGERG